jgi:potassium-transporting ATPase KdpC subunit
MLDIVSGALRVSLVTFVLCGFAYPSAVTVLGQLLTPFQAHGSLATNAEGVVLGSRLIGQNWKDPKWFHGRPSATTDTDPNDSTKTIPAPYNAASSSPSNLGPTSKALQDRLADDRKALDAAQPGLAGKTLPADVLTTSGSGLDPDISPANANLQIERIAKARGAAPDQIAALVARHATSRSLGIFGEPRVNVLELNLELEKSFPARETKEKPPAAEATPAPAPAAPVAATPPPPAVETPAAPVAAAPAAPAGETPAPPVVTAPAAPVAETPAPPAGAAPGVPAAAPPIATEPVPPSAAAATPSAAVFPSAISPQAGDARRKTCLGQYHANAATNSNGGLKWADYWSECKKRLKR